MAVMVHRKNNKLQKSYLHFFYIYYITRDGYSKLHPFLLENSNPGPTMVSTIATAMPLRDDYYLEILVSQKKSIRILVCTTDFEITLNIQDIVIFLKESGELEVLCSL